DRASESERRVLAEEVIRRRMRALDRRVLHGIDDAECGHDLAAGERLDLELVVRRRGDALGYHIGTAEDRVEAAREARRHPPFDLGSRLREGRCRPCREYAGQPGVLDERTTLHPVSPLDAGAA